MRVLSAADHAALDRPIWSALTTSQAGIAVGGPLARRYPPDMTTFGATRDETPEALDALLELTHAAEPVGLVAPARPVVPQDLEIVREATLYQMVALGDVQAPKYDLYNYELGETDVAEMMALAEVTKPGPFAARTHLLGRYIGVRTDGHLVAMAGERMRLRGQIEVSAICVHPAHRGKGYARRLTEILAADMVRRDISPFLHVFADNESAIALYRKLGFEIRRELHLCVLRRPA